VQDNFYKEILEELKLNLQSFKNITCFSQKAGIYAVGVNSAWKFSLISTQIERNPNEIIYIGKTESNQIARDVNTHFSNGKSGSSTLRRSLGAILRVEKNLVPIPRSCTENGTRRFTNYKFTADGEEKLTNWMKKNLSLSYREWDEPLELKKIEEEIIKLECPILNLQKNLNNEWKKEIKTLRKYCRILAEKNSENML